MRRRITIFLESGLYFFIIFFALTYLPHIYSLRLIKTIRGNISPKSIVHSGHGVFSAQNMMYRHTITFYDRKMRLIKTLPDRVNLKKFGFRKYQGTHRGAPVEATYSHNGQYAWISQYRMYGSGFFKPGHDKCGISKTVDKSFVYKIAIETFNIVDVIQTGAVPKFLATSPDDRYVLASNWCNGNVSVIDTELNKQVRTVFVGRYPRGIDIINNTAYVAVMGSYDIAYFDLDTFHVKYIRRVGRSPRHINISANGKYLYATLNGEGKVAKIDLRTKRVIAKAVTGSAPRSMVLSNHDKYLYVVNYRSNTMSKVSTNNMQVLQKVKTGHHPIGITYDSQLKRVWVACYTGQIMVFQD